MDGLTGTSSPRMDWESPDLPAAWRSFKQHAEFTFGGPLKKKSEEEKCNYLMIWVGEKGRDIHNTWNLSEEERVKLKTYYDRFEAHVQPKSNAVFMRYKFNLKVQNETESFDQFVTELRLLAKYCNYGDNTEEMVRDRIVFGCRSKKVRENLIKEGTELTLEKAIDIGRTHEIAQTQLRTMETTTEEINAVGSTRKGKTHGGQRARVKQDKFAKGKKEETTEKAQCGRCGKNHNRKLDCPATGKVCHKCKKKNHFANMCRTKLVNIVKETNDSDSDMYVGAIESNSESNMFINSVHAKEWMETLKVNDKKLTVQLDTGAKCNVLSLKTLKSLKANYKLEKSSARLKSYSGHEIETIGITSLSCEYKDQIYELNFHIVTSDSTSVIGAETCTQLGLIKRIHTVKEESEVCDVEILKEYPDLFKGLGCLPGEHCIRIDPNVKPVIHPPRKVPISLRDKVKKELDNMEEMGVIVKQTEPTDWVNSMVTVVKGGEKVRICIDPRDLNTAIKRQQYPMKTIEDVVAEIVEPGYFSVLDAKSGYWQICLDEASSKLCTFNSPFGRYRFKRLPFGIKSAPEVFQQCMSEMLEGIAGAESIVDDILVWGRTAEEHDARLRQVLDRAREYNLKLNVKKCKVRQETVRYVGHVLTTSGLKPDPEKTRAVESMKPPTSVKELRTFLGFIQYLGKFLPNMAEVSAPLRVLLENNIQWHWEDPQQESFDKLKAMAISTPVLGYFDPKKQTTVSVDASSKGLGAVLLQEDKPIAYASRALTSTQQKYAQIEKETLAIVYGLQKFHHYVYGRSVSVETDHKPLEHILNRPLHLAPLRLQKMMMTLQRYDFAVKYKPGKELLIADALSRSHLPESVEILVEDLEVNEIENTMSHLPISPEKYEQFKKATAEDPVLQKLQAAVSDGWPSVKAETSIDIRVYWSFRDEISCIDGLLFKGHKLIVPFSLRNEMLNIIHKSHFGIVKCKQRAKEVLFWPGMTTHIEERVSKCDICKQFPKAQSKEPMVSSKLPERPWAKVAADLFEFQNAHYLLCVDYYSKWPELARLNNLSSASTINHVKSLISRYGIPDEMVSDNGPQFDSKEFKAFAKEYGFVHTTSSPHYPQSNGEVERYVHTVKQILKKAVDPYLALLDYRNTPLDGIGKSPAQLLMGRRLKTSLPTAAPLLKPVDTEIIRDKLKVRQQKQEFYYNQKAGKELSSLQNGDYVKFQRDRKWINARVVNQHKSPRSYVIKTEDGGCYRRNRRQIHLQTPPDNLSTTQQEADIKTELFGYKSNSSSHLVQEDKTSEADNIKQADPVLEHSDQTSEDSSKSTTIKTTRSGRVIKTPERFKD